MAAACRGRQGDASFSSEPAARWVSRRVLAIPGKASALARRRPTPAAGRLRQRARFAGRPIPSKHNHGLRGHGPDRGTARPRSRGCRLARRSGHLVPAGTRAAPYRPLRQPASGPVVLLLPNSFAKAPRTRWLVQWPLSQSPGRATAPPTRTIGLSPFVHCDSQRPARSRCCLPNSFAEAPPACWLVQRPLSQSPGRATAPPTRTIGLSPFVLLSRPATGSRVCSRSLGKQQRRWLLVHHRG